MVFSMSSRKWDSVGGCHAFAAPGVLAHFRDLERPRKHATPQLNWLLVLLIALGLGLRCYHYVLNPPVWHDEAAQISNVLRKDYSEILGPLYYAEACPPLFLALEKVAVDLLGDSTFALRLVPFLAGCL